MTKKAQIVIAAAAAGAATVIGYAATHASWSEPARFASVLLMLVMMY